MLLVYDADRLVYSAAAFSRSLGIAPWLIDYIIIAFSTSLLESLGLVTVALNNQIDIVMAMF